VSLPIFYHSIASKDENLFKNLPMVIRVYDDIVPSLGGFSVDGGHGESQTAERAVPPGADIRAGGIDEREVEPTGAEVGEGAAQLQRSRPGPCFFPH
jgi:hypothetical protein